MRQDELLQIQKLQFSDKSTAEELLLKFMQNTFPNLQIISVELRPQAVSLNSFNGFLTRKDGTRLFFKTHVEQDNIIDEYYNATMLASAGYPVIQPLYSSKQSGRQILIYELIDSPSVFEVARDIETNSASNYELKSLTTLQNIADDELLAIYLKTLTLQDAETSTKQPIHQLFFHRLTGGRLERFYGHNISIELTSNNQTSMEKVRRYQWIINGIQYSDSIDDIIIRSIDKLRPNSQQPSIIGHGDAHNGNVFYIYNDGLTYFDPAFAGNHHPLLDLTKPLYHNVYAMWMYFPHEESKTTQITVSQEGNTIHIVHDYQLNLVRQMFWTSKQNRVLIPILQKLKEMGQLRSDWRSYLKCALFCCPFLTLDLTQFPPNITLLGLAMAVEMGAESIGSHKSYLDQALDEIELLL